MLYLGVKTEPFHKNILDFLRVIPTVTVTDDVASPTTAPEWHRYEEGSLHSGNMAECIHRGSWLEVCSKGIASALSSIRAKLIIQPVQDLLRGSSPGSLAAVSVARDDVIDGFWLVTVLPGESSYGEAAFQQQSCSELMSELFFCFDFFVLHDTLFVGDLDKIMIEGSPTGTLRTSRLFQDSAMKKRTSIDFAQSLGTRLVELRKELKLHQRDMAQKMGISERVYRRYESGEQVPGSDKLAALLEELKGLSSMWLLMGSGRMFKSADQPHLKQMILDIVGSNPSIERILIMLKALDDEDLGDILFHVTERKKVRDLHTELRDMVKKLERPTPEGSV